MRAITGIGALAIASVIGSVAATPARVSAFTPESPEVVEMIELACDFLERQDWSAAQPGDANAGANALMGMALFKAGRPRAHPKIKQAIEICRSLAGQDTRTMYAPALAAIFLLEMDPVLYKKEIDVYLEYIAKRQRPQNGNAWNYETYQSAGDTSQTQYCVLAYWEALNKGYTLPPKAGVNVLNWLIRTQDVSGAWGYQGREPTGGDRIQQSEVRHSIAAAGLGSVYIAADMLGFANPIGGAEKDPRLPPDVSYVTEEPEGGAPRGGGAIPGVNREWLLRAMSDGNRWFGASPKIDAGGEWQMYYLYGLERYQSFRDKVEARRIPQPKWYDDGVQYLKKHQSPGGSWTEEGLGVANNPDTVATAFGVLFLTRGTMQTIGAVINTEGELQGTGELPVDGDIVERGGQLVGAKISAGVDDLLTALNSGDKEKLAEYAANASTFEFADDETSRAKQSTMLREIVTNADWNARIIVVRAMASRRDLDNVPALIYALSDPDYRVVKEAQKGLRFISRKFDDITLPAEPTDEQKRNAQKLWKKWYLSIRPEGVLFN